MQGSIIPKLRPIFVLGLFLTVFFGCAGENGSTPKEKSAKSLSQSNSPEIYDILEDYPGLENFFTYGDDPQISEFEQRLFGDFLGKDATADVLVSMIDLFPKLINTGSALIKSETDTIRSYFSEDVQDEMESKGPVPDLIANLGVITESIINVDQEKLDPFYDYLDRLDQLEKSSPDVKGTIDYVLDILVEIAGYLDTLDEEDVNIFMNFLVIDLMEMNTYEDGTFDLTDTEELIAEFAAESPEGLIEILEGVRGLFYDQEFKDTFSQLLNNTGKFLGQDEAYEEIKALLENIHGRYTKYTLGEVLQRAWDKGPEIGSVVEELDIDLHGKNGEQDLNLRELLMQPKILNDLLETMYHFRDEGFGFDEVDDQLARMTRSDPFCYDQKGEGQYGNGEFYQPTTTLSYKNYSTFQGLINFLARWNVPFSLVGNVLYESEESQRTKALIKTLVPGANSLSVGSFIWAEQYEKDPDTYMGNGTPITEKQGYGMMLDGVFVAPTCPALVTMANIPLFLMGEATYIGPYDNIYDNLRWEFYERTHYIIIDVVELAPHVPLLKNTILPILKAFGIESLPIIGVKTAGANGIIHLEVQDVVKNLPSAITNEFNKLGLPAWMADTVTALLIKVFPMATHVDDTNRVYILPQDIRDVACLVWALCYFDSNAFHLDRFESLDDPETYRYFYDPRDYNFTDNKDTANRLWNILGAMCVSSYRVYKEAIEGIPASLSYVEERQNAAINSFGHVYPFTYIHNTAVPLTEEPTETSIYERSDEDSVPLLKLLHPLLGMESQGAIDKTFELLAVLGKPDLADGRKKFFSGLAKVVGTMDEDSETPYTVSSEILKIVEKAKENEQRWDSFKLMLDAGNNLLDDVSEYEMVSTIVGLINYLTGVDISDEDWRLASEGIVEVVEKTAEAKAMTRGAVQLATVLDEINSMHIWGDAIDVFNEAVQEDGIVDYVLRGMEKDPDVPWSQVMEDTNDFLHSELMKDYEEGSFWKDIYYLLDFLTEALEPVEE